MSICLSGVSRIRAEKMRTRQRGGKYQICMTVWYYMLSYFNSWHRGKPRKIQPGQKIHNSLLLSSQYTSKASPPPLENIDFWKALQEVSQGTKSQENSKLYETWVELDLYDHIMDALLEVSRDPNLSLNALQEFSRRSMSSKSLLFICMLDQI